MYMLIESQTFMNGFAYFIILYDYNMLIKIVCNMHNIKQIIITVSIFTFEHFSMNECVVKFNTDSCKCFLYYQSYIIHVTVICISSSFIYNSIMKII